MEATITNMQHGCTQLDTTTVQVESRLYVVLQYIAIIWNARICRHTYSTGMEHFVSMDKQASVQTDGQVVNSLPHRSLLIMWHQKAVQS